MSSLVADPNARPGRARRALRGGLALALAVLFFALAFHNIDWEALARSAGAADLRLMAAALLLASLNLMARAARWRLLLSAGGPAPYARTLWSLALGYLANVTLPARAGDVARSYLLGRSTGLGGSFALATTLAERVLDAVFLLAIGALALTLHPAVPPWLARQLAALAILALLGALAVAASPRLWALARARLDRIPARLADRLERFFQGVRSVRGAARLARFFGWTALIWGLDALNATLIAAALGVRLPLPTAFVLLAALGISSAVPLTPGQLGVFQFVTVTVLGSYGVAREPALLLGIALQGLNSLMLLGWGLVSASRLGGLAALRHQLRRAGPPADAFQDDALDAPVAAVPRLRISIVTPSFNQARFIGRTIESVLAQQGDFELEYLVIDGGSTDGTLDILERYPGRLGWSSEPDKGQVHAINRGLRQANGDVVGWLNSDDMLLPGALARVAAAFQAHPEAEWLHGRCRIIDEHDREVRRWVSLYKHLRSRRHSLDNLLLENYVSQMTVFWQRRVLDSIGYLDPTLPLAFDYDLWLRLARRSDPIYLDAPLACFRWYEASKSGSQFEAQLREAAAAAARQADDRPRALQRIRRRTDVILRAYRLMALGRRLQRRLLG